MANMICQICLGYEWVCEVHNDKPWDGMMLPDAQKDSCCCGGAGKPCPNRCWQAKENA